MKGREASVPYFRMLRSHGEQLVEDAVRAAARGGREICGLLVSNGYFIKPISLRNKVATGGGYAFSSLEVRKVVEAVRILRDEVLGTYHSHPSYIARPGESDIAGVPDDSIMLIVDVLGRKTALWRIKGQRAQRLRLRWIDLRAR